MPRRPAQSREFPPSTLEALLRMKSEGRIRPDGEDTGHGAGDGVGHETGHEKPADPEGGPAIPERRPDAQQAARQAAQQASRQAEPSWLRVIGTTVRLWVRRRSGKQADTSRKRRWAIALVALVLAALAAGGLTTARLQQSVTNTPGTGRAASTGGRGGAALGTSAAVGQRAAGWVATQVSGDAIVACDPGICPALQADGFPAENLLVLRSASADPLGSDVIVATQAVRNRLGSRLRLVYAPTVIASFGSGAARIDVLAVAADGANAYRAEARSDQIARRAAGAELIRNPRIHAAAGASRDLAAGQVDSRLLITLAALATWHSLDILGFSGSAPGASPGVPLRVMDISGTGNPAQLQTIRTFLLGQRPPFLPARVGMVRPGSGPAALRIEFGAPSPLGLLGARGTQ